MVSNKRQCFVYRMMMLNYRRYGVFMQGVDAKQ